MRTEIALIMDYFISHNSLGWTSGKHVHPNVTDDFSKRYTDWVNRMILFGAPYWKFPFDLSLVL